MRKLVPKVEKPNTLAKNSVSGPTGKRRGLEQRDRELALRIEPNFFAAQSRCQRQSFNLFVGVLVTVFRMDRLAGLQRDGDAESFDGHFL